MTTTKIPKFTAVSIRAELYVLSPRKRKAESKNFTQEKNKHAHTVVSTEPFLSLRVQSPSNEGEREREVCTSQVSSGRSHTHK